VNRRAEAALLAGKVALVTGAGAGIGRGIAELYAAHGARVVIAEILPERAEAAREAIALAGGEALALPTDVRDAEQMARTVDAARTRYGGLDVLVNNVGGTFPQPFLELSEKGWEALVRANLKSVFHCTRAVVPLLIERGGGAVVNVVSIEGLRAAPLHAAYAACKAAVISLTQSLALELAPHGVRVNAIAPDLCITEGLRGLATESELERQARRVPLGRAAAPAEIAGPALFLASELASYVTGATLPVDGGTHAAGGWYPSPAGTGYILGEPARGGGGAARLPTRS
jgi:NAD(P)-dependent dehydrogenase (short-subunit alcohol dehydrogenase family)